MDRTAEVLWQAGQCIWQATWRASVLIGVVLAVRVLLGRRLAPRWGYALWLVVVARLLLPWGPASRASLFNLLPHATATSTATLGGTPPAALVIGDGSVARTPPGEHPEAATGQESTARMSGLSPGHPRITLVSLLPCIWLAGALVLGAHVAVSHLKLWRIVRFQRAVTHSTVLRVIEDCRARMRVSTLLGAVLTDQVQSPALFGFVRPRLLIPSAMSRQVSSQDLRHVFLHEMAHLKQHDIALGWLTSFCQVLHWFNPLVWLAFHQMRADRELACDDLAMSHMDGPADARGYGQTLVRLQEVLGPTRPLASLAAILEGRSQLKTRIRRIVAFGGSRSWNPALGVTLLLVLGAAGLTDATKGGVALPGVRPGHVQAQAGTAETPQAIPDAGEAESVEANEGGMAWVDATDERLDPGNTPIQGLGPSDKGIPSELKDRAFLHYDLERIDGKRVVDVSAAGHHGLVHGDPAPGEGIEGAALSFDGLDDFISTETMPGADFTVCLWVKPDQPVRGQCRDVLILVSPQAQLEIGIDGFGQVQWRSMTDRGSQSSSLTQFQQASPETWSHVAAVRADGVIHLYLNGARADNRAIRWNPSTQFLNIGGGSYSSWRGLIDEVVVFTEALTPDQIGRIVSQVRPVATGSPGGNPVQQGFVQHDLEWGLAMGDQVSHAYPDNGLGQAMARSTLRQWGARLEAIMGQWPARAIRGDWTQADDTVTPLRALLVQLQSASGTSPAQTRPDGSMGPETAYMPPGSLARAVEVLAQAPADRAKAQAAVADMARRLESIIAATGSRDAASLQAGCSGLRQSYQQLVTCLGLDRDPMFQTDTRPNRPAVTRPPPNRVRGRTVLRGR